MSLFEKLRTIASQQNQSGEFPTWLMAEIIGIADNPERYEAKKMLVEKLISEIGNFDQYAGVGCFETSVGIESIQATLRQVRLQ
jgi:hypothetical protein